MPPTKAPNSFENPNHFLFEKIHLQNDDDIIDDSHLVDTNEGRLRVHVINIRHHFYSGFFTSGRDYESAYVNHKYTEKEKQELLKLNAEYQINQLISVASYF